MDVVKVKYRKRTSDGWWEAGVPSFTGLAETFEQAIYNLTRAMLPPAEPSPETLAAMSDAWMNDFEENIKYEIV